MSSFVIIGLGSIGRRHATNLKAIVPDAEFTFVRRSATKDPFVTQIGGRSITSLDQALETGPDLAVLATPSALHIDLLPQLIESGVPLLVEKPMVTTLEDCDRCADMLAKAETVRRAAAFNFRHVASLQTARDMIANGDLGTPVRASFKAGQWLPDWRPGTDYRDSYSASKQLGGGVELDLVHEIDLARWFFGELDLRFAMGRQFSSLKMDVHDVSTMVLAPKQGGPIVDISLDYVARTRIRRYEIVGETGTLTWDIKGRLSLTRSGSETTVLEAEGGFDIAQSYIDMMRAMVSGSGPHCSDDLQSVSDGLQSTRLAIQAAQQGASQ